LIAADVNMDGKVSITDLTQIKSLLLGQITEFSSGKSWVFLDPEYRLETGDAPWTLEEGLMVRDLSIDSYEEDLMGIKLGDVNETISTSENRSANATLVVYIEDQVLDIGEMSRLEMSIPDRVQLGAIEWTFDLDGVEVLEREGMDDYAYERDDELRFVAFSSGESIELKNFRLDLRGTKKKWLGDAIKVNSQRQALAYDLNGREYKVEFSFVNNKEQPLLLQNLPNPFKDQTSIGFYIPEAGPVRIDLFDVSGKQLKSIQSTYNAGHNEVDILLEDLEGATGVLHYQMIYKGFVLSKRMVVID